MLGDKVPGKKTADLPPHPGREKVSGPTKAESGLEFGTPATGLEAAPPLGYESRPDLGDTNAQRFNDVNVEVESPGHPDAAVPKAVGQNLPAGERSIIEVLSGNREVKDPAMLLEEVLNLAQKNSQDTAPKA